MKFLLYITIFHAVWWSLALVESSHAQERSVRIRSSSVRGDPSAQRRGYQLFCNLPSVPCYVKYPVCGSDGKTYRTICELLHANCRLKKNIRMVKKGKCPACKSQGPVQCLVPACFRPNCPAFPKAICVSFCPCQSQYYYKSRKVNCNPVTQSNPCSTKFCGSDGICKVVNGKALCVSKGPECSLPKFVGPCKAKFQRFYYNSVTRECEEFEYGGCRGNENNFKTKEFCESTCKAEGVCSLPAVPGPCEARIERYFYNRNTSRCEKFYYGGCQGNKNNFKTTQECESNCSRSRAVNPCATVKCEADTKCAVKYGKPFCQPVLVNPCKKVRCGTGAKCIVKLGKPFCLLVNACETVKCKFGRKCVLILGQPVCQRVLANPCIATLCLVGTKCVVVNGEGKCIAITSPTVNPLCAAISCLEGTKCVVKNGKATCATPCLSNRDCKQQGSFCSRLSGVCKCKRFCGSKYRPVCGSDGRRYRNRCKLDASACKKKARIMIFQCRGKNYKKF